jgi:predicted RecA/RadA family phage recombinase
VKTQSDHLNVLLIACVPHSPLSTLHSNLFSFIISKHINQEKMMQARFVHDGKAIDFFPEADTPAGTVIVQGSLVGITKADIGAGRLGAVHVVGVYDVEKSNVAIPLGSKVYWDTAAKKAVVAATGNTLLGVAVAEATADDTIVRIRIG